MPDHVSTTRPLRVYPLLVLGLVSFSVSPILVRFAGEAPGLAIAVWRTLFAVVMLAPFALRRVGREVRTFSLRERLLIGAAGVLLGLHFVAWIESLYHTTVASASVLVTSSPIFIAVLGYIFLREQLARRAVAAVVLGVIGAALIGWGDAAAVSETAPRPWLGNGLALLAAFIVSIYLLIGRVVRQRLSWIGYVFPLYCIVALTTAVLALLLDTPLLGYELEFYGLCALMALGPSIIGHGSFNYAIRYFPAAILGLLSLLEPVGASILAFVLFGEVPGGIALFGMSQVLVAVTIAMWPKRWSRQPVSPSS